MQASCLIIPPIQRASIGRLQQAVEVDGRDPHHVNGELIEPGNVAWLAATRGGS
jgi:hypothetical protein